MGNIEIRPNILQPRALDDNGNIKLDLWTFELKNEYDFEKLNENEILELTPGDKIEFLPPWIEINTEGSFEKELKKEITKKHILFGRTVEAIGKREDKDDVLFKIDGEELAVVHLTWKGEKESSSEYPRTKIYSHWTEVYEQVILRDNIEFEI